MHFLLSSPRSSDFYFTAPRATMDRGRRKNSNGGPVVTSASHSSLTTNSTTTNASGAIPKVSSAPPLHQTASLPVTLTLTTAITMDLKVTFRQRLGVRFVVLDAVTVPVEWFYCVTLTLYFLILQTLRPSKPPGYPRPFLQQTAPPTESAEDQQTGSGRSSQHSSYSMRTVAFHSPFGGRGVVTPPGSSSSKLPTGMIGKRPLTDPSGIKKSRRAPHEDPFPDIEEEKVQQLKNVRIF